MGRDTSHWTRLLQVRYRTAAYTSLGKAQGARFPREAKAEPRASLVLFPTRQTAPGEILQDALPHGRLTNLGSNRGQNVMALPPRSPHLIVEMRKTNKKDPRAPANVPPQPQPQPRSCQVQPGRAGGGSPGALPAAAPRRRLAAVGGGWRPLGLGAGPRRCLRTDSSGAAAAAAGRRRGEEGARGPAAAAPNR